MGKSILVIRNSIVYPLASNYIQKIAYILGEMEFDVYGLSEEDDLYQDNLEKFSQMARTEIECKAVITCNAISMDRILESMDCLYITYLEGNLKDYHEKLLSGNQNTVIFCSNQQNIEYIKENYKNIGKVLYADFACTGDAFVIQELIAMKQGTQGVLKLMINKSLEASNIAQAKTLIEQYKKKVPADLDIYAMETIYELQKGNLDLALKHAKEGVRRYPCNADLYYNLGNIHESRREWFWAWLAYKRASVIYGYTKDRKAAKLGLEEWIENCRKQYEEYPDTDQHANFEDMMRNQCGLEEAAFRGMNQQILGRYYWESATEKRYAGIYRDYASRHEDLIYTKGEFVKVTEGNKFEILTEHVDVLLPVAAENNGTFHKIRHGKDEYTIFQNYNRHFNYYRIPAKSMISSSGNSYYGRPIPLVQEEDKKKLVLNIFMDGLAQCILDGEDFIRNMPNTEKFFNRGTICTRAYNTAEWTYPGIVNYVTGMDTIKHMLFHKDLDGSIPEEYPTLAEYFQEKGYFTAKMCGNWRIIPTYGHARGYDQFIYQHQWQGFKAETIVGEVIDHIEAFKETNQFLWISIGDLHDVADGIDMPNSVQSSLELKNCIYEEVGPTSVKQEYSENKRVIYKKMARRIDCLLNSVYQYIEDNYKNEDILVTLFSDHGQGYLVPVGAHFCAEERSRVAFMFRGDKVKEQMCSEVVSTSDYIKIMCHLADIEMKDIEISGKLPRAFGGEGREYAITESIHPGDPYNAAIYDDDSVFYFTNPYPVQDDGRFYLKEYRAALTDMQGNLLDDTEKYKKYLAIILEHIAPLCIYE